MRILIVHTYYQLRGGEDVVFEQEADLLNETNEVKKIIFRNKNGFKALFQFLLSIWNWRASEKIKKAIKEFGPDVIHIHNWHYACGPIIIRAAKSMNVPVVLTLHNYRLLCPSTTLLYKGKLFTNSLNASFPWIAIKNRVYRNSVLQTFYLAWIIWFHKRIGTWNFVSKYIVLTEFAKNLFINSTFNVLPDKYVINQNFVNEHVDKKDIGRSDAFLFIGRLSEEKGIKLLLKTFSEINLKLDIGGDGPDKIKVVEVCTLYNNINYLGRLDKDNVAIAMSQCTALIFPSIWYEGMPMTILEAFKTGTPVIASNLGAMSSMVQHGINGLLFKVNNPQSFEKTICYWNNLSKKEKHTYCINARNTYKQYYTSKASLNNLNNIYKSIIDL